jgi:hypothetical protein
VLLLGSYKEHGVMIYLSKDLYTGFIRLQADKGLGRSYAGLLPFTEGLFRLGYISKEVYEEHFKKYSTPLVVEKPETNVSSLEQQKAKQLLAHKDWQFKEMLAQWDLHPSRDWRAKAFKHAEQWKDKLESARLLIAKKESAI